MHGRGTQLGRHEKERIALQQVARVQQNYASRVGVPHGIDDRRRRRQRPGGVGRVRVVIPPAKAPVHVGGSSYGQVIPGLTHRKGTADRP
jgi:hypothetical protein